MGTGQGTSSQILSWYRAAASAAKNRVFTRKYLSEGFIMMMYFSRQDVSLFTFPMVITAFFSAMMGGLLAPLVVNVAARLMLMWWLMWLQGRRKHYMYHCAHTAVVVFHAVEFIH